MATRQTKYPRILPALLLAGAVFFLAWPAGADQQEKGGPEPVTSEMTCPVCGMYPARYPRWHAQILFADNSRAAFDSGKCMFRYLLRTEKFDAKHSPRTVARIWVKDFDTGNWTDGRKTYYVVGSSVMGPMGKGLVPFADRDSARKFQQQHGGAIEPYDNITLATMKTLRGMMHHQ